MFETTDKFGKKVGGTITTSMLVSHLPKSMCVEVPGYYPRFHTKGEKAGQPMLDPETGEQVWQPAEGGEALSVEAWNQAAEEQAADGVASVEGAEAEAEAEAEAAIEVEAAVEVVEAAEAEAVAEAEAEAEAEVVAEAEAIVEAAADGEGGDATPA